ncbi:hypothetical protein [Halobacillus trueperi]|uniref:hypothetical protein n=1 Tax=Halobacillus trueperi TaxID=156205 RepID=UPI0037369979
MKKILIVIATILVVLFVTSACTNSDQSSVEQEGDSSEGNEATTSSDDNRERVREFLEHEFNGPSEKTEEIYREGTTEELRNYIEETYKPYFNEKGYEDITQLQKASMYISVASRSGYELNATDINIDKDEENNAYAFEVDVEYSKDGETNSTTVKGRINLDEDGKFSFLRYSDRGGLIESM